MVPVAGREEPFSPIGVLEALIPLCIRIWRKYHESSLFYRCSGLCPCRDRTRFRWRRDDSEDPSRLRESRWHVGCRDEQMRREKDVSAGMFRGASVGRRPSFYELSLGSTASGRAYLLGVAAVSP